MRFMMLYKSGKEGSDSQAAALQDAVPNEAEMIAMGNLMEEMTRSGVLLATEGLLPSAKGARVRVSNGEFTVTDGPFTEARELIAGYAVVQVKSKAEAIEWAKRFLAVTGEGESEIRELFDPADFASA
jgi:hypothetical protein